MPYKSERIPIAGTRLDRRVRLSEEQKDAIRILGEHGYSQRKMAEMFRCSKGAVQNVLKPQKRVSSSNMPTEYWTRKKREYRQRKQGLFIDGKLNFKTKRQMKS